jgi:hypothetical protein
MIRNTTQQQNKYNNNKPLINVQKSQFWNFDSTLTVRKHKNFKLKMITHYGSNNYTIIKYGAFPFRKKEVSCYFLTLLLLNKIT